MILKFKYHADTGLLEAYRSYTLAQNNSLSDEVVVTSTDPNASRYNYCLEFICYNSKSIPKAQYVSPILAYGSEGVSFTLPNNLTQFRGHVDMQLTGYDPDDNSIVFKSISKNCKAFDVEGSLCVLEKDLNDTPNVFTEVFLQLEQLRNVRQDVIDEAMAQFGKQIFDKVESLRWYRVRYYVDGELIDERLTLGGNKINPPKYDLPTYCVVVGGWYDPARERLWDMEADMVEGDTDLYLNFMTDDVVIEGGVVTSLGKHAGAHIYYPDYYEGQKVKSLSPQIYASVPSESYIHLNDNVDDFADFEGLMYYADITGIHTPAHFTACSSVNGSLYASLGEENVLVFTPKRLIVRIDSSCTAINYLAIINEKLQLLYIPESVQMLSSHCIVNTALEELVLPSRLITIDNQAVYNNPKLKRVIITSDISEQLYDDTFINDDLRGNVTRPALYVLPQHYESYKSRNLPYEIKALGEEYLDGRYAQKEA